MKLKGEASMGVMICTTTGNKHQEIVVVRSRDQTSQPAPALTQTWRPNRWRHHDGCGQESIIHQVDLRYILALALLHLPAQRHNFEGM